MTVCKQFILALLALAFTMQLSAQMTLEDRIEIKLNDGFENEKIYTSSEKCFVLESRSAKKTNDKHEIKYDLYDSNLKLTKTASFYVPGNMFEAESYSNDSCVYKFYRNSKREYLLSKVLIKNLEISTIQGKIPSGIKVIDMRVVGSKAWFQSSLKRKSCLLQIDLNTRESKISEFIQDKWDKKTNIVNYQVDPVSGELLMFVNKFIKKGSCELSQVRVNESCELCDNVQLTGTDDKVITSVSGCRMADSSMVYTGTYSDRLTTVSQGMFFASLSEKKLNYINYFNFVDMENFLKYMTTKQQDRVEKNKKKAAAKGNEYSISYNIAAHDIIPVKDGYILIGEAYYATYTSHMHTTTTVVNGIPSTRTSYVTVFNGYQYTHAFIAKFSSNGELLWDQSFEMYPAQKPMQVKRFVRISEKTDNDIAIVFVSRNYVISKLIDFDGNLVADKKAELIGTGKETEKISWTTSEANYWFGSNFLIYGSQRVKDSEDKSRRKVFFVNKVSF